MSSLTFTNNKNLFFRTLKKKVDAYFTSGNIQPRGNRKLYLKSGLQLATALGLYLSLVIFSPGLVVSFILYGLLGLNLAVLGFNIMHEGGHSSFSNNKWLNKASGYFLNVLGGNSYFWKIKHNINHHTYTNIEGLDNDIDIKPFMRLHKGQPRFGIHKFQHYYWVVLYGISYIAWVFYHDFQKYFTGYIVPGEKHKISLKEHIIFWVSKIMYVVAFIVIPILTLGLLKALVGYTILAIACGLFIAIVFQLAHTVEGSEFPQPHEETNKIAQEWAIHQINTTANFATNNKLVSWFLGGLNFQVEHHLFPKVSHVHYPQINKIVKETCEEFNIAYREHPTMIGAIKSHLWHIREMGRE